MSQADEANGQGGPLDSILAQWRLARPDIDPSPMAVCGAVWRAGERIRQGLAGNLAGAELDFAGFDVLMTLRRQGERGGSLTPSELAKDMMLSTSAMTNRLDRLEKRELIARQADPQDRRSLRILLTPEGFALIERLVVSHVATEERLLSALGASERDQLKALLAKVAAGEVE
ncbi:MarR family transcriptional regulator [Bosea sp. Tri-44]|uniref:MarR family winged helix-turn-helix transcriptional regulator n=1 Tax=Bosea sp. Tri-44 TaxID=1972137 RepID=UPI00100FA3CF|nr:MarR family transcriptional regulator [Bosea sp. Tri-44]RXT48253.1 MarR family transcriptional regulator [Bosea sp. Tri-44]